MSGCTPPPIPYLKQALNKWIPDICARHDEAWTTRKWADKWRADVRATFDITVRGAVLLICGVLSPLWFMGPGNIYWLWKKYKKDIL